MTQRIGSWAQQTLRAFRGKKLCNVVKITREDGFVSSFTDLDRPITFEGVTYVPAVFAGMSAERREAALKSGNQEATGIIDDSYVVLQDLLGDRYRGAEVEHRIIDWGVPMLCYGRNRKWIRSVTFTDVAFVATLEGRTQELQRPAGGRFGGTFTTTCPYKLGNEFCKADVGASGGRQSGIRVDTIESLRMSVTTLAAGWNDTFGDDYFRDGDMVWRWSQPIVASTATSGVTDTTLVDATQSWTTDEHVGRELRILTIDDGPVERFKRIIANTATTITVESGGLGLGTHSSGKHYDICGFAANLGVVSPIVGYEDATRKLTFLIPTPFPIAIGDSGIVTVGCNGLKTTCIDKFDNLDNFGGDPEAPSAGDVISPLIEQDSDRDGWPDHVDAFPDDPTRH